MATAPTTGGCACGAVRYDLSAPPKFSFHCQCRHCQRASGCGHMSILVVPAEALTVSGDLAFYEQDADSGNLVRRGFCPTCGSPLMTINTGYSDNRYLAAASLDDPGLFVPEQIVWSSSAQSWDHIDPALPTS